jgi:hypothetical protein
MLSQKIQPDEYGWRKQPLFVSDAQRAQELRGRLYIPYQCDVVSVQQDAEWAVAVAAPATVFWLSFL